MGVPLLYYTLFRRYGEKKIKTEACCIDMNSMLYKFFSKDKQKFIHHVLDFINRLKYDHIYLAFDGTAPMAKMVQQKMRRIQVDYSNDDIHPIMFTPGTELMEYVRNAIIQYTNGVIVSSHRVPGEGEQKIMRWIRTTNHKSYTIIGNDADILLLAMTCDNVYVSNDGEMIDIEFMKHDIVQRFGNIESFMFMTFLLGNDFLPCLGGLENLYKVLEFIFEKRLGKNIVKGLSIQWNKLDSIINELKFEFPTFPRKGFNKALDTLMNERDYTFYLRQKLKCGEDNNYSVNGKVVEQDMINNWRQMIQWNIRYYLGYPVSWKLYYSFHDVPSLTMLQQSKSHTNYIDDNSVPLKPINAMLTVLPYWWHHISNCKEYPEFRKQFPEQYPRNVKMKNDSNIKFYMEKPMIPFPNYDQSKSIIINHPLNEFEEEFITSGRKVKFKLYDRALLKRLCSDTLNVDIEHPIFLSVNDRKVYCNRKLLFETDQESIDDLYNFVIKELK